MSKDLLFELGTEEIPPGDLPGIAENFREDIVEGLEGARLGFEQVKLFYTPRRLALRVTDLEEAQEDRVEEHRGPPEDIGRDEEGNYTVAARKFAEGHGASEEDVYLKETDNGSYLFVEEKIEGSSARELLPELLPEIVENLEQPEKMRWNDSGIKFIRPIRWVVCLLGDELVDLSIGGLSSDRETRGHRFHGRGRFDLKRISDYEELLESNYVIPDPEERKRRLSAELEEKLEELDVENAADESFIDLLAHSLEYPSIVSGSFPEEYLELPPELLFKTLTGEARLIPLVDSAGKPVSSFVGFRDGSPESAAQVQRGYESVIYARLRDSMFFYRHDREQPLEEYLEELETVTFQEKLGSIWDKVRRMREIAERVTEEVEGLDPDIADRTVLLSKADLVTEVVDEFPSLEGTIGAYYADMDDEPEEVVAGIREHYLPRKSSDEPPRSKTGIVTSISDKIDTLFGSFLIGEEPSGTSDPYGLRRKADGIIRTLVDREISLDLAELIGFVDDIYGFEGQPDTGDKLRSYFAERIDRVLERTYGVPYDIVDAVNSRDGLEPLDAYTRATALAGFKQRPEMKDLVDSFTRLVNITEGEEAGDFSTELFQLEEEKVLWDELASREDRLEKLLDQGSYEKMIEELLQLKDPIDSYFDNVMVMADEEKLRENRIDFLLYLKQEFLKLGDLSKVVTE